MTRQEATDFIKKIKKKYGKDYKRELAKRTGCNPNDYDDYGLVYMMGRNNTMKARIASKVQAMKGHGEDLFKDDGNKGLKENYFRNIVKMATRSVLNEAAGFTPNPDDYENSMFYSHDIPIEPNLSEEELGKLVRTFKRAASNLLASIHDIEYTGIEKFEDFYDELRRSGWNDFANDKI